MLTCSVEGCDRPHKAFGWCGTHYRQWRRHGAGQPTRIRVRPACSIEDCDKPHFGRGYCQMHYARWRNNGDANVVLRHIGDAPRNFWAKVRIPTDPTECWVWTGAINSSGYGSFGVNRSSIEAHRWAYQDANGPVPRGRELDHLCHTNDETCAGGISCLHRRCVNPTHLEAVRPRDNWARGRAPSVENSKKTHCKHGHEFTPANTYYRPAGGRQCRKCMYISIAKYQARLRGSAY